MANKNRFCKCIRTLTYFYLHNGICKSCGLPEGTLGAWTDAKKIAVVLRHRLKSLSGAKKILSEAEEVKLIEQAILRYGAKVKREVLREAAKEFMCGDISYWKPREIVKLILSLLPTKA